ncbi:MAG: NAD-dependent epimerase/dehydratase family protein [Thiobacillus sp.]|nr:NAD-dependent epimerase/dehydratase family protein [Thiobacillus sp.]
MEKETIIVTGIAGFIGAHCGLRLLEMGHRVIGIDNINSYYDPKLKRSRLELLNKFKEFEFLQSDIQAIDDLRINHSNVSRILHLAAQAGVRYSIENPEAYIQSNLVGFCRMLEYSRKHNIRDFVYASSSSVYGNSNSVPFFEGQDTEQPVSLYAATKKSNELLAHSYAHLYGLHCTGLRFFTVYGPWGRPDMAPYLFTDAVLKGRPIKLFNHGEMLRDFTYIDDIADAVIKVVFANKKGEGGFSPGKQFAKTASQGSFRILNIGNNSPIPLNKLVEAIETATQKKAEIVFECMQPGDVKKTYASIDTLAEWIAFQPTTKIEQGIQKFVDWYLNYYQPKIVP